jgi:hypothetical protein
MSKRDELERLYVEIKEESENSVKYMIDKVVKHYTKELDDLIREIDDIATKIKNREVDEYGESELEADILKITTQIYFAGRDLAYLGGEKDLASSKRKELYNEVILNGKGTVQEKRAKAENYSVDEQTMEDVFNRAYKQLKSKIDQADNVLMSLKKVYSKKMLEMEVLKKGIEY